MINLDQIAVNFSRQKIRFWLSKPFSFEKAYLSHQESMNGGSFAKRKKYNKTIDSPSAHLVLHSFLLQAVVSLQLDWHSALHPVNFWVTPPRRQLNRIGFDVKPAPPTATLPKPRRGWPPLLRPPNDCKRAAQPPPWRTPPGLVGLVDPNILPHRLPPLNLPSQGLPRPGLPRFRWLSTITREQTRARTNKYLLILQAKKHFW